MQLIKLTIRKGTAVVRDLAFKRGLNLILDKPTASPTQSGNSIGKTTVLRLIDYCLGSEGDDIWRDLEFKTVNQEVYDFLHNAPAATITLTCRDASHSSHTLKRSFDKKRGASSLVIDDVSTRSIAEYRAKVRMLLFGVGGTKPTLRQLVPKFVRSSPALMIKTLKYLGDYTSESDYEGIDLFLFGFFDVQVLEDRTRLKAAKKQYERDLQTLNRLRREGEIEQLLLHLRREVEEMSASPAIRGDVPEIALSADNITRTRASAAIAVETASRLDSEIDAIMRTISEYENDYASVDHYAIETIYKEAHRYIPDLQHDWSEVSAFVQNLRARKQRFLEAQVAELKSRSASAMTQLAELQMRERDEISALVRSPEIAKALELRSDLQDKLKQLGSLEQALKDIRDLKEKLESTESLLTASTKRIEQGRALLTERVSTFNKYFSELSKALHGEKYLLSFEENTRGVFTFQLTAVGTNVGSGKKVSQTAAFDLAYIEFLAQAKIRFPAFVCHDGLESIHANQLHALLQIAEKLDGQLIVSTLRDKLPAGSEAIIEGTTVLELAHDDRLFKF